MSATPFRLICVPLDGSPFAEQALPAAAEIARRSGAMLQLALVHHPVPALATALEVPEIEAQLDQENRVREQTYLGSIVERVRMTANVPVTGALLDGAVADALQGHVEESQADLVVITTHGRGPMSRFWLGSVADHLMRRLHVPVLIIRPEGSTPPPIELKTILVALDGSSFAERALDVAVALGKPFGAAFGLVMVIEPPLPIADPSGLAVLPAMAETEKQLRSGASRYLDGIAGRLRQEGHVVRTYAVEGPRAAEAIIAQADVTDADLIVLASHGAGGFERLVLGSVADKVIRASSHPTLIVRPPAA
jgi:nucleotide-binding universal stress UspA family protein